MSTMSPALVEHRITHLAGHALPQRNKVRAILLAVDGTRCLARMPIAPISNLACVISWTNEDHAFNAETPDAYALIREHMAHQWKGVSYTWLIVPRLAHYSVRKPTRAAFDGPSPFAVRRAEFHAHLDACQQCRENPMKLCETGQTLLKLTAVGVSSTEAPVSNVQVVGGVLFDSEPPLTFAETFIKPSDDVTAEGTNL